MTPHWSRLGAGLDGLGEVDEGRSAAALGLLMGLVGPGWVAGEED